MQTSTPARSRLTASALSATVLATGLAGITLTAASPAAAATVVTAAPVRFALPGTDPVTDVLAVGADVWVSAGTSVLIVTRTGQVRKTVPGLLGARGLTLSPDARSVYVSSAGAATITQVSTAGAVLGSWPVQACPGKSAIAAGALYYAYGCGSGGHGVGRLDLAAHTDASVLSSFSAQSLTAAGSTLVTYTSGGSGFDLTSYAIGGDGSLTKNASVQTGGMYDAEISPDGSQVVTTDYDHGYGVARYATATMALNGTFATGPYPEAVAWSPDGTRFAGFQNAFGTDLPVRVFSAADGSTRTRSTSAAGVSYGSDAHEAAWSPDGRYLYSLSQGSAERAYLVVTPVAGQVRRALTVSVTPPAAYGKTVKVTVRTARPALPVTVTVTQNGRTTTRVLKINSSGLGVWSLAGRASGTVTATAPADLSAQASSATTRFVTPSALTARLAGATRVSKGLTHYAALTAVHAAMQIQPQRPGTVSVVLQHRSGGAWRTDQSVKMATLGDGTLQVGLRSGNRKMTYRFVAKAVADSTAGASPSVVSASFVID